MMNLYGRGMMLYGWDKKEKLNKIYSRLSKNSEPLLLDTMNNFIFEMDAPIEETEKRYSDTFEKYHNILTWQELNHFYIRHRLFEKSDEMYKELFLKHRELFEESPEYAYRAFIDYVTLYGRDLKYALQCYLDSKDAFRDTDIEGFLELELMLMCNSFNEPERFLLDRKKFVDQGLISEESYHKEAFVAHLANLNDSEASEQYNFLKQYPHEIDPKTGKTILSKEEAYFLSWVEGKKIVMPSFPDSMQEKYAKEVYAQYESETWHKEINNSMKNRFAISKTVAIDAWSLYQLAARDELDTLENLECVYVTHLTITRLLHELVVTDNRRIRIILGYLKLSDKVRIYSAGFKVQLEVRNVINYDEPSSALAVAIEKDCLTIYGEPQFDEQLVKSFNNRIVRINEIEKLL